MSEVDLGAANGWKAGNVGTRNALGEQPSGQGGCHPKSKFSATVYSKGSRINISVRTRNFLSGKRPSPMLPVRKRPRCSRDAVPRQSREQNVRILVVDDESDLLTIASEGLGIAGFEVLTASNGEDALALPNDGVDVLFADLLMPGMSGLELAHQASRGHRNLRVVLTSGYLPLGNALPSAWQFLDTPHSLQ
jgi:CheY-like chemotaxis protein